MNIQKIVLRKSDKYLFNINNLNNLKLNNQTYKVKDSNKALYDLFCQSELSFFW